MLTSSYVDIASMPKKDTTAGPNWKCVVKLQQTDSCHTLDAFLHLNPLVDQLVEAVLGIWCGPFGFHHSSNISRTIEEKYIQARCGPVGTATSHEAISRKYWAIEY